jgi:glycogen debranching enzyme
VHRDEPAFDPGTYWRGPAWPQLTYLFWVAARAHGRAGDAAWLADALVLGADRSGFAEYWHPDTGRGLGAVPQSWATLAAVVAAADGARR